MSVDLTSITAESMSSEAVLPSEDRAFVCKTNDPSVKDAEFRVKPPTSPVKVELVPLLETPTEVSAVKPTLLVKSEEPASTEIE